MTTDVINGVPLEFLEELHTHLDNIADFDPSYPPDTMPRNTSAELLLQLRALLATAQPAADGEREAFVFAAKPYYGSFEWDYGQHRFYDDHVQRAWRLWQARAAQPQRAVAVTDEVRRLREALERVKLTEKEARHHSFSCALYWNNAVTACIATLSAHKTGEEE